MIVVQSIDGLAVEMAGDYYETVVMLTREVAEADQLLGDEIFEEVRRCASEGRVLLQRRSRTRPSATLIAKLQAAQGVVSAVVLEPVLPILGRKSLTVHYEAERGGVSHEEVWQRMERLVEVFETSISAGLGGTEYEDRILPCQSGDFDKKEKSGELIPGDVLNRIILYVSSMGVIVAAPTAGSCGALPGAVFGVCDAMGWERPRRVEAMLVAGLIGVFITAHSTFAAEVAGCMAECGSGSSMAAAALTGLAGGSLEQQLGAASQALQNSFGMTCDTLANRVEAPCLGKNVMAATNALACSNMALANYRHLVPLDEVIHAMKQAGDLMPREICCTGLGGLAITPTSREFERKLAGKGC